MRRDLAEAHLEHDALMAVELGRQRSQRRRGEAAVGRQRLHVQVEVEVEACRDLAGARGSAELLAQVGLHGGDPRLRLLHGAWGADHPAVVAEVAAYLTTDRGDGVAEEV